MRVEKKVVSNAHDTPYSSLCENVTSSAKPEVLNVSQRGHGRIEGHHAKKMWVSGYASGHTHHNKKHLKNAGPNRHCEPPHCHSPGVATVARPHCRTPPAHRCPPQQRRQQRQRVTEGTAMAPIEWAQ